MREEAEAINRHDLKNPLMVVLEVPKVLSRQPNITPEQTTWLKMIEDAGRKTLEMINQWRYARRSFSRSRKEAYAGKSKETGTTLTVLLPKPGQGL